MTGLSSGLAQNKGPIGGFGQGFTGSYNAIKGMADKEAEQNAVGKILSGDETGWQDWGKVNPQGAMNAWNNQQKLKQTNGFGVGTAKGEYAQLLALRNDPKTPKEMLPSIDRRMNVLEKDPNIVLQESINRSFGTKQGNYAGDQWTKGKKGWLNVGGEDMVLKGSEAEREWLKDNSKEMHNNDVILRGASTVPVDIDRALKLIDSDPSITGFSGGMISHIQGTPAYDLKELIGSVQSQIGIDTLLDIKRSGAGLGQVPQTQLEMLSSILGNLNQAQSKDQLIFNLRRVKELYNGILDKARQSNDRIMSKIYDPNTETKQSTDIKEGQTAINKATGQRIIYQNGEWRPL